MMKRLAIFFICIFTISCLDESVPPVTVGIITGTIYNSQTMEVVQGVSVTTEPATSAIITGSDGSFEIVDVPEGEYTLTASHPSYEAKTTTVQVIADRSVTVDLQLTSLGPELTVSEDALNFGTDTDNLTFHIQNTGIGTMNWTLTKNQTWLTVSPTSGTTTTETDIVNVSVNRSDYSPGNYTDVISLSSDANAKSISVIMTIANTTGPQISVSPASFDFGSSQTEQSFDINNTGIGSLSWNASSSNNWISIETTSGTISTEPGYTNISVNRADLSAGTYSGSISFTSNGGNQTVSVTVSVEEANLSISPTTLDFGNSSSELEIYISNNGSSTVQWQITPTANWISANPENGSVAVTPVSSVISVDRAQLNMGDFDGNIIISYSGNSTTIPVTVSVTSAVLDNPELQVTDTDVTSISLAWPRNTETSSFQSYVLRRSTQPDISESDPVITTITNSSDNSYTDMGLPGSTSYYYKVYAVNNDGVGSGSNEISATTQTQLGNWSVIATLGTTLNGIDVFNENFVYAVGSSGAIFYYNGSDWTQETSPTTSTIYDVKIISTTDIWAVGSDIYHYDGINWSMAYESSICYSIDAIDANNIWVGGSSGNFYHYDGNDWSLTDVTSSDIEDLHLIDENNGWAVGNSGKVFYFNGIGWSLNQEAENFAWYSILAFNSSDIWLYRNINYYAQISHWNGTDWSIFLTLNDSGGGAAISGMSSNDIWFGSTEGYIHHWNGNDLQEITSPTSNNINDLKMTSSDDGWAVGENGVVLRYN